MLRYSLVFLVGLCVAGAAGAATWADAQFEELSKDFGSVPRGPTLVHLFRLTNKTKTIITIANVRVSCGCVTANALKTVLNPGEETAVVAQMDTSRFSGIKTVTIYVQFERPGWEEVRLWVQANSRDDFTVTPDTLAFGQSKRGSVSVAKVRATFFSDSQLHVLEVQSDSNYVMTTLQEVSRTETEVTYELTATLRPEAPVGKWFTDVWLRTNNLGMPRVRVPLTVEIESALSVSTPVVSLGQPKVGTEAERKLVVRGVKPFKITSVRGTDNEVSVKDSSTESKAVHVLTVKLRGTKPGEVTKTLRVITDLKDEGEIEFQAKADVIP